jgi:hypothetical protein
MSRILVMATVGLLFLTGCAAPTTPIVSSSILPSLRPSQVAPQASNAATSPLASDLAASPARSAGSSPSAEIATATAYIEAINSGNVESAAALIAPGAKARTSSGSAYQTLADAAAIRSFVSMSPPCILKIERVSQNASSVVVMGVVDTGSSPSCPAPVGTGIAIPLTIVDGLITVIG